MCFECHISSALMPNELFASGVYGFPGSLSPIEEAGSVLSNVDYMP